MSGGVFPVPRLTIVVSSYTRDICNIPKPSRFNAEPRLSDAALPGSIYNPIGEDGNTGIDLALQDRALADIAAPGEDIMSTYPEERCVL